MSMECFPLIRSEKKELPANYANRIRLTHSFIAHHSFFLSVLGNCLHIASVQPRGKIMNTFLIKMFYLYFAGRSLGESSVTTNSKLSDRNVNKYLKIAVHINFQLLMIVFGC